MSIEKASIDVFDKPIFTEVMQAGSFDVLLVRGCDQLFASELALKISLEGSNWIRELQHVHGSKSRRGISFYRIGGEKIVIKQKRKVENKAEFPGLPIAYFTMSFLHEVGTSLALHQILLQDLPIPVTIEYLEERYDIKYVTQIPLLAVVNRENPTERYTVFRFIEGESVRDKTNDEGGWNNLEQNDRKLFGKMHSLLNEIAQLLLSYQIEPWDLGVHQIIYHLNELEKQIVLGIIDTEEYNFSNLYGEHWPESYTRIGLPAVLMYESIFG